MSSPATLLRMEASEGHKRDTDSDQQLSFGEVIKRLRLAEGLSQRKAALRCAITQARWAQVERGYESAGTPAKAGADFVLKVAEGFHQDRDEMLRLAGINPADVPVNTELDIPQSWWMEVWPDLTPKQRVAAYLTVRLMADPEAVIDLDELRKDLGDTPLSSDNTEDNIRIR